MEAFINLWSQNNKECISFQNRKAIQTQKEIVPVNILVGLRRNSQGEGTVNLGRFRFVIPGEKF